MSYFNYLFVISAMQISAFAWSADSIFKSYIHSPASRIIKPNSIYGIEGNVTNQLGLLSQSKYGTTLSGINSTIILDFDQITTGLISFNYTVSDENQRLGMAFSESSYYATRSSDSSIELNGEVDGALDIALDNKSWNSPSEYLRGGFRYLTLFLRTNGSVEINSIRNYYTAVPNQSDDSLQDYSGYFYSDDDLLNRIWYAAAYTLQLSTIGSGASRNTSDSQNWNNTERINPLNENDYLLVDGAKRDRTEWPGDFATASTSTFIANNKDNMKSLKNSLISLYSEVDEETGLLPYAGSPLSKGPMSFTYHLWTLIATYEYWLYSGDYQFIYNIWISFSRGINVSLDKIDEVGLLYVPKNQSSSWGREPTYGHDLTTNTILCQALNYGSQLARKFNHTDIADNWFNSMNNVRTAINNNLWNGSMGMFKDNDTDAGTLLYPQDGNSLAVLYNVTGDDRSKIISSNLRQRWNEFGAVSPEGLDAISPFISGLELSAHIKADNITNAIDLMRLEWGYMLNAFSDSTLIEGYYHDGTLHYPFYGSLDSYISHAHAWSTAPIMILTQDILGLKVIDVKGSKWEFSPKDINVKHLESGFTILNETFTASINKSSEKFSYYILNVPKGTVGTIKLPINDVEVYKNGNMKIILNNNIITGELESNGKYLKINDVQGTNDIIEIIIATQNDFTPNWDSQTDPSRPVSNAFA